MRNDIIFKVMMSVCALGAASIAYHPQCQIRQTLFTSKDSVGCELAQETQIIIRFGLGSQLTAFPCSSLNGRWHSS